MKPVHHMNFACNLGLMHAMCTSCNGETLHKNGKCVHCAGQMARRTQSHAWTMDDVIKRQSTLATARGVAIKSRRLASV